MNSGGYSNPQLDDLLEKARVERDVSTRMAMYQQAQQMIVDDRWVSIGSSNLDNRSFRLNDEANMNVLDQKFAEEQIKLFEGDLGKSKRITYEQWKSRPWHEKLSEGMSSLLGSQL